MSSIIAFRIEKLLGSGGLVCIENGLGGSVTSGTGAEVLDFLVHSCHSVSLSAPRVLADLDEGVAVILSLLPDTVRHQLSSTKRSVWEGCRLFYIPEKIFSLNKNHDEVAFYDLAQYFPDDDLSQMTVSDLQSKSSLLSAVLSDLGIPSPKTLSSPIACFKASGLMDEYQSPIPTIFEAPESHLEAYEIALQCTPREWVSNYQAGHWGVGELWNYDLASAYPHHASQLIDLRDCSFHKSDAMDDTAYFGFLEGDFTVYPDHPLAFCSPFLADRGDGTLVNFTGTVPSYTCLLDEVRTLYRYGLGEFHLKSGWFVKPLSGVRPRVPFNVLMTQLYAERGGSGEMSTEMSNLLSYFLKRVMNGLIGKLLETHKDADGNVLEYGDLYNPIYHALCTTRTRLQVLDFIAQNAITEDELVFVGVDGVRATRHLQLPEQAPMGRWRCTGSQPTFILSPGAVITPTRNSKKTGYADLLEECVTRPSAYKLGRDSKDPIDLSKIFLNQTRRFDTLPDTGDWLLCGKYPSRPVEL